MIISAVVGDQNVTDLNEEQINHLIETFYKHDEKSAGKARVIECNICAALAEKFKYILTAQGADIEENNTCKANRAKLVINEKNISSLTRDELIHIIANIFQNNEAMWGGRVSHIILCSGCSELADKFKIVLLELDAINAIQG